MDTKSNTEPLAPVTFDEFAPTSYETWKAAAIESLKGGIFEKKLFTKTPEGIVLSPIYTEAEAAPYKERLSFPGATDFLRGTKTAGYAEEPWKIAQEVEATDPAEANKVLLEELNKGTNAVNFDAEAVALNTLQDVETLLDQVQLKYAPLSVYAGATALPLLAAILRRQKKVGDDAPLTGCVGADPIGEAVKKGGFDSSFESYVEQMAKTLKCALKVAPELKVIYIQSSVYHNGGANAIQEAAAALATALTYIDALVEKYRHVEILPGPFVSTISTGCVERARDISFGAKYNTFGIHGTGISVAVDSLAAVRELVFEKHLVSLGELVELLDTDFASRPDILAAAKAAPKMGNADKRVDEIARRVIDFWGHAFDGKRNDRGGIFRPGTGSAMYYVWHAREIHASPCGRLTGEPFPANWAPSLDIPVKGPVSVIRSFTEPDLGLVSNGGPLTIEIHGSAFLMPDGIDKVAELVRFFILRGGHQMQINAIDRKTLLDAQEHPEKHRHLIVRVWGWSGYFVELDREFQNQIIRRVELAAS